MRNYSVKLLVKGAFGNGNLGDDALLEATIRLARKVVPDDDIAIDATPAQYLSKRFPQCRFVTGDDQVNVTSALVIGGGTQFCSFSRTHALAAGTLANRCLRACRRPSALIRTKPLITLASTAKRVAVGVGVGPFVCCSLERLASKRYLRTFDYVSVRDKASYAQCASWGVVPLALTADLCMSKLVSRSGGYSLPVPERRIGVVLRDWPHTRLTSQLNDRVTTVAESLLAMGYRVDLISFCPDGDARWLHYMENRPFSIVRYNPCQDDPDTFARRLQRYSTLITARYHGAVFSALAGVPFIAIEIEPKLRLVGELLADGVTHWSPPFDVGAVLRSVKELEARPTRLIAGMATAAFQACDAALADERAVLSLLSQRA